MKAYNIRSAEYGKIKERKKVADLGELIGILSDPTMPRKVFQFLNL
jgi:hypothetical protein